MGVQSQIDRIITAVGNAYRKVSERGGTVPASQTVANLAMAIDSIPAGGATKPYIEEIYDSDGNLIDVKLYGYTKIRDSAFYNCVNLALTSLPEGITSIGYYAFSRCTGLTSLTFLGTPTSIASSAFQNCPNLTTINVPWADGAVTDAPWGATNATINYNYTGG